MQSIPSQRLLIPSCMRAAFFHSCPPCKPGHPQAWRTAGCGHPGPCHPGPAQRQSPALQDGGSVALYATQIAMHTGDEGIIYHGIILAALLLALVNCPLPSASISTFPAAPTVFPQASITNASLTETHATVSTPFVLMISLLQNGTEHERVEFGEDN